MWWPNKSSYILIAMHRNLVYHWGKNRKSHIRTGNKWSEESLWHTPRYMLILKPMSVFNKMRHGLCICSDGQSYSCCWFPNSFLCNILFPYQGQCWNSIINNIKKHYYKTCCSWLATGLLPVALENSPLWTHHVFVILHGNVIFSLPIEKSYKRLS